MKALLLAGRLLFGAWMLANGANHFALHLWPEPAGTQPLAVQLMSALVHSGLLDVAMGLQLAAGALILAGLLVPLALCIVMPVGVCAAYWAVMLEHEPLGALLALAAVALNGLLMLAWLETYRAMLVRYAPTRGEGRPSFEQAYIHATGRTARADFVRALIPLGAAAIFYHFLVFGGSGDYAMLVLLFPAIVLHARRLHDMGRTAWLLLVPALPVAAAIWLHMYDKGHGIEPVMIWAALGVSALFTLWGLAGRSAGKAVPA